MPTERRRAVTDVGTGTRSGDGAVAIPVGRVVVTKALLKL